MPLLKNELLNLLVDNEFGVLTRVTAAVRREGWNIKSLSVAETENPGISAISLCVEFYEATLHRLIDRLSKMNAIHSITVFKEGAHAARELAMAAFTAPPGNLPELQKNFGAILFRQQGRFIVQSAGTPRQIDAFIAALGPGVAGIVRSGAVFLNLPEEDEEAKEHA